MRTVEQLLQAKENKWLGNHRMANGLNSEFQKTRLFYHYTTMICYVNDVSKTFAIDNGYGSSSTTRATNAYRKNLLEQGYTEIELKIN